MPRKLPIPFRGRRFPIALANSSISRLYRKGCIVLTVALVVCAVSSLSLRFWLRAENKKLDRAEDGEVHSFRYVL